MMMERLGVATVLVEVGTTMNDQENGVIDMEEEEEKVSVNVDDDERKEDWKKKFLEALGNPEERESNRKVKNLKIKTTIKQ